MRMRSVSCNRVLLYLFSLRTGDEILKTSTGLPDSVKKALATHSIDTVALLGHAANELSLLRREQIKPILKPEYYPLCITEIPNAQLLFEDDLAKRARDAQDTSKLANKLGSITKSQPRPSGRFSQKFDPTHKRDNSRPFFREGPTAIPSEKTTYLAFKRQRQEVLAKLERIKQTVRKFEDFVPSLRAYFLKRCELYQAGGLGNSIEAWKQLTSDQEILRDISGVHIPCAYRPEQHLAGLKNNIPHIPAIDTEISKML